MRPTHAVLVALLVLPATALARAPGDQPPGQEPRMSEPPPAATPATLPPAPHHNDLALERAEAVVREVTTVHGTGAAAGPHCVYCFNSASDSSDTAPGGLANFQAGMTVDGATATGHKTALMSVIAVTGTTANRPDLRSYYTAQGNHAIASVNDNGTAERPVGSLFGGNDIVNLRAGATHWRDVTGREITMSVREGASVAYKVGIQVVDDDRSVGQGSVADYGYSLANQPGGRQAGWRFGFSVGAQQGVWPIARDGTIFGTDGTKLGGPVYAAAYGIDLGAVAFSKAAFRSKGFAVDGEGATSARTLTLKEVSADAVTPPPAGSQTIFLDAADHRLKRKDSKGAITVIG